MTCLAVGFSKGHYGICDYLLTEHQADVNFKTDDGLTLVLITIELDISTSSVQQLEYIVVKHNADCTCTDINGRNAFHYLALNQSEQRSSSLNEREQSCLKTNYYRMGQILLDHNCNPYQMDNKAQTPLMLALVSKNFILVDFLINQAKLELNCDVSHDRIVGNAPPDLAALKTRWTRNCRRAAGLFTVNLIRQRSTFQ